MAKPLLHTGIRKGLCLPKPKLRIFGFFANQMASNEVAFSSGSSSFPTGCRLRHNPAFYKEIIF